MRVGYVALVEDDTSIADLYGLGLSVAGFNVCAFPDPTTFLTSLEVGAPELVVLDWNLPGMNGGEVLTSLRCDSRTRATPVIILSNLTGMEGGEIDLATSLGTVAWLVKSRTTPQSLARKVAEGLCVPPAVRSRTSFPTRLAN